MLPDAVELLPKLVWHFDEPFADSSMIPTYYVSEATRRRVKVALSGDGGDEMFMGYPWFMDHPAYRYYKRVPSRLRRPLLTTISNLPGDSRFVTLARKAKEKGYDDQTPLERYLLRIIHFDDDEVARLVRQGSSESLRQLHATSYVASYIAKADSSDFLNSVDYATIKTYLPEDILVKVDRMSMAVSLEVRCPFLDHRLADFLGTVSSNQKVGRNDPKYLLKRVAAKHELLPMEILRRKKHGFGAPVDYWFKGEWRDIAAQLLDSGLEGRGLGAMLSSQQVSELRRKPFQNADKLFALVVLTLWYKMYIERDRGVPSLSISDYV
jgi:asparagine synthase (glutamine-hydrolysing)